MIVKICTNCGQGTSILDLKGELWRCPCCKMRQLDLAECIADSTTLSASSIWLKVNAEDRSMTELAGLANTDIEEIKYFLELYRVQCRDFKPSLQEELIGDVPREMQEEHNCVYLIQASNGVTKVGRSSNLKGRLGALRTSSPLPLTLLHVVECKSYDASIVEKAMHVLLSPFWLYGEWFMIPKDMLSRLCKLRNDNLHYLLNLAFR